MHTLLAGELRPITSTIGFIRCGKDIAVQAYLDWQAKIQAPRGVAFVRSEIPGGLSDALLRLLPLHSVETRRFLFVLTASDWTAFFDNGHQGTDVFAPLSYLAERLQCEAVRATDVPDVRRATEFPARIWELWGPGPSEFLNYRRSVAATNDGRKWSFSAAGAVQPYEQTGRYASPRLRDRFTSAMLDDYLKALDIEASSEGYYLPAGTPATLLEKRGPIAPGAREFRLAEVQ